MIRCIKNVQFQTTSQLYNTIGELDNFAPSLYPPKLPRANGACGYRDKWYHWAMQGWAPQLMLPGRVVLLLLTHKRTLLSVLMTGFHLCRELLAGISGVTASNWSSLLGISGVMQVRSGVFLRKPTRLQLCKEQCSLAIERASGPRCLHSGSGRTWHTTLDEKSNFIMITMYEI